MKTERLIQVDSYEKSLSVAGAAQFYIRAEFDGSAIPASAVESDTGAPGAWIHAL